MKMSGVRSGTVLMLGFVAFAGPVAASATQVDTGLAAAAAPVVQPFVADRDFAGVILVRRNGHDDAFVRAGDGSEGWDESTPFRVGSLTKTFTAEVVLRLVEHGDLALSDSASRFVPEIANWPPLTIEQLLAHSAGVPDYYGLLRFRSDRTKHMDPTAFAGWIRSEKLDFEPGTASAYSNSGYNLLALVIERVTHRAYAEVLHDEVFGPLGMDGTASSVGVSVPGMPAGLEPDNSADLLGPPTPTDLGWLVGSGSVYSNARDLAIWGEEMLQRGLHPQGLHFYGWGVRARSGVPYLEQTGRIPGFAAVLRIFPAQGLVIVVLSRIESDAAAHVADQVEALAFGDAPETLRERTVAPPGEVNLGDYPGVYEMAPGFRVTVGLSEGGLGVAVGEGDGLQYGALQALGDDRFFFRVGYIEVGFVRDSTGTVTGLTWGGGGPFPKVH